MSEERKEGVQRVWVSPAGHVWLREPTESERRSGTFHTAYLHDPPEGAPEPGERRVIGRSNAVVTARHVYRAYNNKWYVASRWETSGRLDTHRLDDWLSLSLARPKPKYRLAAVELTEEQVEDLSDFIGTRRLRDYGSQSRVASLLRIEEIPE